jgi:hypothetical protein
MSDQKFRGQGPRGGHAQTGTPGARTVLGVPAADAGRPGSGRPPARPGLSGRTPGQVDEPITLSGATGPHGPHPDGVPDTLYMDPPSESRPPAETQTLYMDAPSESQPAAKTQTPTRERQPMTTPPPPPPPGPYNSSAPESWRSAARNVAERSKKSTKPSPKSDSQHLRLKLDSDGYDEFYRGVPKSRLPVVVLAFLFLLGAAGGAAYWAQDHGGLAAIAVRFHLMQQEPAAATTAEQPLGTRNEGVAASPQPAAPGSVNAPTAAAQPGAAANDPQPSAAAAPAPKQVQPAPPRNAESAKQAPTPVAPTDTNAAALADPEPPGAAPAKAAAAAPARAPAVSKPAQRKPSPPARPVVRHDPVIKIRDLAAPSNPDLPPEPSGTPYVPAVPIDPPAPDEPR